VKLGQADVVRGKAMLVNHATNISL